MSSRSSDSDGIGPARTLLRPPQMLEADDDLEPLGATSAANTSVTVDVQGKRFTLSRTGRGRYEVRSGGRNVRVGTITVSNGFLQVTAEKITLLVMIEIATLTLQLVGL